MLLLVERCAECWNLRSNVIQWYDNTSEQKRCSRLKNIIIYRVEEPENNIHHDQEGSCWNNFTNFFKNVKYNILGVTVKATIVWAIVYVIAIIINSVGESYKSICEDGKFF